MRRQLTPSWCPARQPDDELGELSLDALYHQFALVPIDNNAMADRQAKPGSLTWRFGGEKRHIDLVNDLRRNASAIISDAHLDPVTAALGGELDSW